MCPATPARLHRTPWLSLTVGVDAYIDPPVLRSKFATLFCLRRPYLFSCKRKDMEEKSAFSSETAITYLLKRLWSSAPLLLTLAGHRYAPPAIVGDG